MPDNPNQPVFGYVACKRCDTAVRTEVAYKTQQHCPDCFRAYANEILDPVMVVVAGREKIVLRSHKHSTADREQRRRAKKEAKQRPDVKERMRIVSQCNQRATAKLRRIFPELFEVLLADERAKVGLDAWTIDRTLTPGEASSSLEMLKSYYHVDQESTHGDPHPRSTTP